MVREFAKGIVDLFRSISNAEYSERSHQVELIGKMDDENEKSIDVICTIQLKHYIPRDVYGEAGYFYEKERKRKIRNANKDWITVADTVTYYEMSEADKKFVYVSYVYHHLDQRQISKLSGIPQPYVYRYIKHMKLKPKYENTPKSKRNIEINLKDTTDLKNLLNGNDTVSLHDMKNMIVSIGEKPEPMDESIDFKLDFHLDPFPSRSEWKLRREEYGLKNGENWRNTPYDQNPGPKQYGDGSKVQRRKNAKQERREKRRIKNIKKYNLHQNNRYGMTKENPDGIFKSKDGDK